MRFRGDDLRVATREGHEANLILFCVDASGSMAARKRMEQVKTAILSLLLDAYQRRDKVGLVTFRGDRADLVLPPTHSVDIAAARLGRAARRRPHAAGRGTARGRPRARGRAGPRPAPPSAARRRHRRPRDRRPRRRRRSRLAADHLARRGIAALVVDCETGAFRLGLASELAAPPARRARAGRRGQRRRPHRRRPRARGMTHPLEHATSTTSSRADATYAPSSPTSRSTPTRSNGSCRRPTRAPSVGHSQPWDFVLVRDTAHPRAVPGARRDRARDLRRLADRRAAARRSTGSRSRASASRRSASSSPTTPTAAAPRCSAGTRSTTPGSTPRCLAIQNLWLAATAEGLGVGWVSFYREEFLRDLLGIPERVRPIAWLCVGPVTHLEEVPDLERHGWRQKRPLAEAIHHEKYGSHCMPKGQPLVVPDDGLTTRQRRNQPLLMVHTGDGKGKSTAAFGLAIRSWNQGWNVGVFQFVKSAKWRIGEQTVLERLGELHERDRRGRPGRVAQDGRRLVVVAQGRRRGRPRRRGRRGLGRDQAPAGRGDPRPLRARRVHLPDEVGLGRRRRRGRDAARTGRDASTS